ncbi:probable membrane-associated kinase regulator 1 [Magnolia sinica]|uniref:probable membrane-associated kinase regulator 1 n=1 Tax=Magnolia sinica TaxID=86752 RepID=UPI0026591121|nr:probable membrane-associated kinase regulator 1 [Magnolia sinica]
MVIPPPEISTTTPKIQSPSSSDFEFTISLSPTSQKPSHLCPADELFYKGQLLPLHLSPRLSMVRTILASSSSSSSSSSDAPTRDSTSSSTDSSDLLLESARPSSATDDFYLDEDFKKPRKFKYFTKFSSVFTRKDSKNVPSKRITTTAKEVIRKYVKKVKPLYDKFASKQNFQPKTNVVTPTTAITAVGFAMRRDLMCGDGVGIGGIYSHSFSGNLRYPRRRSCISSCPSSMRSSPSHSGVLRGGGVGGGGMYSDSSSMEELQSAIQGAIAHCKKSLKEDDLMVDGGVSGGN